MDFPKAIQLADLALDLDCEFRGPAEHLTYGFNEIHRVRPGDLVFVDHPKYYDKALNSAATTILINQEVDVPAGKGILISSDPFRDFNKLTQKYFPFKASQDLIDPSAKIGENTIIQPGAFIGPGVKIGKDCLIHSNVSIYQDCIIGDSVSIHANTVIGADAFYFKKRPETYEPLATGGTVIIENDVIIGASCTIDRGVSAETRIGQGTRIDNSVHIAHDTLIGKRCLFASQVGIAGCCNIEDDVTLWGQVGVGSDTTIGAGAVVLGQSGVTKSLAGGKTYFGYPVGEAKQKYKELAALRALPKTIEELKG